jgi:hypothetical protein
VSLAPNSTLLFIPDISGFTDFVNETEINHSRHIIEELMESLIDANELEMKVSEIEGDAILFYRPGALPSSSALYSQVKRMFVDFHTLLKKYEQNRICQCGACSTATNLSLKFVLHYGEVAENQIKNHSKLFGREVIVVHRLLKNSIPNRQYALLTEPIFQSRDSSSPPEEEPWNKPHHGEEIYDIGNIPIQHFDLEPLLAAIPDPVIEDFSVAGATQSVLRLEHVILAPLELTFDVLSDLAFRAEWIDGLVDSDQLNHQISQTGSTHRCVIKRNDSDPKFVAHDYKVGRDIISFVESNHRSEFCTVYLLRRQDSGKTTIELEVFIKPSFIKGLFFKLFLKPKLSKSQVRNLEQLNAYCQKLVSIGQNHNNHIELYAKTNN